MKRYLRLLAGSLACLMPASWGFPQEAGVLVRQLDAGKASARVLSVRDHDRTVGYLPARLVAVDEQGKPTQLSVEVLDGGEVLVSGRLQFVADAEDLKLLQQQVQAKLGKDYRLTRMSVDSFACWLQVNGKNVWQRPSGDGPMRMLPFQTTVPGKDGRPQAGTFLVQVAWLERQEKMGVKVLILWKEVEKGIRKEIEARGWIDEQKLEKLVEEGFAANWFRVEVQGEDTPRDLRQRLRPLLAARLRKRLLALDEPRAMPEDLKAKKAEPGLILSYGLRTDVQRQSIQEWLDLRVTCEQERTALIAIPWKP